MTSVFWTHLAKDLRIEWRSKDAINSMLFFALLVVVLFSHGVRSARRVFAADCRRRALRGHDVRLGQRAQPGLGARDSPPGDGCAAHGAELRRAALPSPRSWSTSSSSPSCRSRWRRSSWSCTTCTSRGRRGCWRWFCRWARGRWLPMESFFAALVHSQPQSRTAAAADPVSHLSCRRCWAWCRPPRPSSPAKAIPWLWIKMLTGYDIIFTTVSLLLFDVVFHAE